MTNADHADQSTLPKWAARVSKDQIQKLYHSVGRGLLDEDLINDVSFALLARCESIIAATDASRGAATCPVCKHSVTHGCQDEEALSCSACGWTCLWRAYKKTYQHKQLHAGGIEEFVREYVQMFIASKAANDRLVLIDTLIHRYHWENSDRPSRPAAANLIQGKTSELTAFLDKLNYGEHIPPGIEAHRQAWREKRERADASWVRVPKT